MKKLLLSAFLTCSSLFGSIEGVDEIKVLKGLKNNLSVPSRIDKVSSLADIYLEKEINKNGGRNITFLFIIDSESKFDKNKLKEAYNRDYNKDSCTTEIKRLFGDDNKNTINYRIMFRGEDVFTLSYIYEDCNK